MAKILLNYPPWLHNILKFTSLKWLKIILKGNWHQKKVVDFLILSESLSQIMKNKTKIRSKALLFR
jgi:hypothetical protein